jgi:hypothetical protein
MPRLDLGNEFAKATLCSIDVLAGTAQERSMIAMPQRFDDLGMLGDRVAGVDDSGAGVEPSDMEVEMQDGPGIDEEVITREFDELTVELLIKAIEIMEVPILGPMSRPGHLLNKAP